MLAFSGCYYGGGDEERRQLGEIRKRWENLPVRTPTPGHLPVSPTSTEFPSGVGSGGGATERKVPVESLRSWTYAPSAGSRERLLRLRGVGRDIRRREDSRSLESALPQLLHQGDASLRGRAEASDAVRVSPRGC